jgi:hypothetical protein
MGEWKYNSTILELGTSWSSVGRFTPRSLYSQGKYAGSLLDWRLVGSQSRSGRCTEDKNFSLSGARIEFKLQIILYCINRKKNYFPEDSLLCPDRLRGPTMLQIPSALQYIPGRRYAFFPSYVIMA